jgi:hypothetical protein
MKKFDFGKVFAALALVALVLGGVFAGCEQLTEIVAITASDPPSAAVVIDERGLLEAVADPDIRDIVVMEGFKAEGDVAVGSAKTITIAKGETLTLPALTVNAPLSLNGQDTAVLSSSGMLAVKAVSRSGAQAEYGILRVNRALTVSPEINMELKAGIALVFTAAVLADDIAIDGLLKVEDGSLCYKLTADAEATAFTPGGSGHIQVGESEPVAVADAALAVEQVQTGGNGGNNGGDEEEDEEEVFIPAVVTKLELKKVSDDGGNLTDLDTDDDGNKVLKLGVGGTAKLAAEITMQNNNDAKPAVTWLSQMPGVVSVDGEGNVEVKGDGSVQITAVAGGRSDNCTIIASMGGRLIIIMAEEETLADLSGETGTVLENAFAYISKDESGATKYRIMLDDDETDNTANGYTIGAGAGSSKTEKTTGARTDLEITIKGTKDGGAVTIKKEAVGALFTVYGTSGNEPQLILENITLQGYSSNNKPLVIIGNGLTTSKGQLTMEADSRITGNTNSGAGSAGVWIKANSKFTMEDGKIDTNASTYTGTDNVSKGGGVCVANNATFNMKGGVIAANTSTSFGAAVFIGYKDSKSGIFNKTGGTIYGGKTADGDNANKVSVVTGNGASAIVSIKSDGAVSKYRNTAADAAVQLSVANTGGVSGTGWGF